MASQFGQGNVFVIETDERFQPEIQKAGDRLVIVDFTASWCGPCRKVAPIFAEFSIKYPSAVFLKVDVDQCQMTATTYDVRAMPTFMFFKNGNKVDEMKGADAVTLESKIKHWIGMTDTIFVDPKRVNMGRSWDCFHQLLSNPCDVFMDVSELLMKFTSNIMNNPANPKYRSIRVSNKIFQSRLLPVSGGVECLFAMGFEEREEYLVFPEDGSMEAMKTLRDALHDERKRKPTASQQQSQVQQQQGTGPAALARSLETELGVFYRKLQSMAAHVLKYDEPELQAKTLSIMPVDEFKKKAKETSKKSKVGGAEGVEEGDCLLLELTSWFKGTFFKWVDEPVCPSCNVTSVRQGYVIPTPDEAKWGAGNVESFRCPNCGQHIRFPRFNHPAKLLETRAGRCGEWANCFTLCCRALGCETRYIVDWNDHVWTEVYSKAQKRWIHFDSCEGICDKPLIYENGWGKNMTYVVAFSAEEIVDVTWRYSCKHNEVLRNRTSVSENWLLNTLKDMTRECQKNLSPERRLMLEKRAMQEMIEFLSIKSANEEEQHGRRSGSVAWQKIRGEAGTAKVSEKHEPFIFKPTEEEVQAQRFCLRYCPSDDRYYRSCEENTKDAVHDIEGWASAIAAMDSVFRKVEQDWQMVYLARTEGCSTGSVTWQVDFSNSGLVVDSVTIVTRSTTFENGQVDWELVGGDENEKHVLKLDGDGQPTITQELHGSKTLKLSATLFGGTGNNAWQHAQLFRQKTTSLNEFPLDISVTLCRPKAQQ